MTALASLLLQPDPPSFQGYNNTASNISRLFLDIFQDEDTRNSIFLHTDRALPRIQKLFEILQHDSLAPSFSQRLLEALVLPLIQGDDQLVTVDQATPLVGSILPMITKVSTSCFRQFMGVLLDIEGLLDRLLSHERYTLDFRGWVISRIDRLDKHLIVRLTDKLVGVCDKCSFDHGINQTCQEWYTLKDLMDALEPMAHSIEREGIEKNQKAKDLPLLAGMRMLKPGDKKTNQARRADPIGFEIPEPVLYKLALLNIKQPESLRVVQSLQEEVASHNMITILFKIVGSYPCRLCYETAIGAQTLLKKDPKIPEHSASDKAKYDIFGKRVGLWKVLLSDRAFKASKKLARTGMTETNGALICWFLFVSIFLT